MSSKNTEMHNLKNWIIRVTVFFDTCHEGTQKTKGTYVFRAKTTVKWGDATHVSIVRNVSHLCLWFGISFYLLFMQGLRPCTVANVTAALHSITWPLVELWLAISEDAPGHLDKRVRVTRKSLFIVNSFKMS